MHVVWNNLQLAWGTLRLGEAFQSYEQTGHRAYWEDIPLIPGHWISNRNSELWRLRPRDRVKVAFFL